MNLLYHSPVTKPVTSCSVSFIFCPFLYLLSIFRTSLSLLKRNQAVNRSDRFTASIKGTLYIMIFIWFSYFRTISYASYPPGTCLPVQDRTVRIKASRLQIHHQSSEEPEGSCFLTEPDRPESHMRRELPDRL